MEKSEYKNYFKTEEKHWWFEGQRKILLNLISKYFVNKKNLNVVDAGCGTGFNIFFLQKFGEVIGIDYSREALNYCLKRGITNTIHTKIENTKLEKQSIDLITSIGVFYHKDVNTDKVLKEFNRILKKKGKIIICTPAIKFLRHRFFRTTHDYLNHTGRRHNYNELKKQIETHGISVIKISYFTFFLFFPIVFFRVINNFISYFFKINKKSEIYNYNIFVNYILKKIMFLEAFILKYLNFPFGISLMVIDEKNEL